MGWYIQSLVDALRTGVPTSAHPPILSQAREQTSVDRQSQRVYYRYIQCAPATPPRTPGPGDIFGQPLGLPVTLIPRLPGRCSSQKHAGGRTSQPPSPREVAFTAGLGRREEDNFEL